MTASYPTHDDRAPFSPGHPVNGSFRMRLRSCRRKGCSAADKEQALEWFAVGARDDQRKHRVWRHSRSSTLHDTISPGVPLELPPVPLSVCAGGSSFGETTAGGIPGFDDV